MQLSTHTRVKLQVRLECSHRCKIEYLVAVEGQEYHILGDFLATGTGMTMPLPVPILQLPQRKFRKELLNYKNI